MTTNPPEPPKTTSFYGPTGPFIPETDLIPPITLVAESGTLPATGQAMDTAAIGVGALTLVVAGFALTKAARR